MRGHVPPREYIVIETAARVSRPTGMRRRRDMKQLINKIALALALAPGCGEYEGTMETRSELDPVVLDETTPSFSFTAFTISKICSTSCGARPIEGSSSRMVSGLDISARPMAHICCSPPDV